MRIESNEKSTKSFFTEMVNILFQNRALMKKPDRKLVNLFVFYSVSLIVSLVFAGLFVCLIVKTGEVLDGAIFLSLIAFIDLITVISLTSMLKHRKRFMNSNEPSVIILDETGISFSRDDVIIMGIAWKNMAFVRAFKESLVFFDKSVTSSMIFVDEWHKDEVLNYIFDNRIPVEVIQ